MKKQAPVIVIFGITGDLSKRYLLPSLYHLLRQDVLPADTKIVGLSRRPLDSADLLKTIELCVLETDKVCDPAGLEKFKQALVTHKLDPAQAADFTQLKTLLNGFDAGHERTRLLYMSVPTDAYGPIIKQLGAKGLNDRRTRLLLEKPFGDSLSSAKRLIDLVGMTFAEEQVYRIDHYLAKEGTQNLLGFRFYNPAFRELWCSRYVSRVSVRAIETIGIENRSDFYEKTGALRDFTQNHLMQLLSVALMDVPDVISSAAIHQAKQAFLSQLLPADPAKAVRGQYRGYVDEVDNPDSNTETYARLELFSGSESWQGTTFILETGKRMDSRVAEVVLEFKTETGQPERVVFNIQPGEDIKFEASGRSPLGPASSRADLNFHYKDASFKHEHVDAYERVIMDAVQGDQSLFASDAEVIESWRVLQPVIDEWAAGASGLSLYEPGSSGPASDR